MKSIPVGVAGRQIGLAMVLVLSAALATLLFSFLGTITCSALVGMMLGATQRWQWRVILVSLVFPSVMAAFLHFSKTDLTDKQMVLLPIVCFDSFWLTYLATSVLLRFEKRSESATSTPVVDCAAPRAQPAGELAAHQFQVESGLAELQGTWEQIALGQAEPPSCKRLEFVRDQIAVSRVAGGQAQRVAVGTVRLEKAGPFSVLRLLHAQTDGSGVASGRGGLPPAWIYRVVGPTLVLAANFEQAAVGGPPALETYARQGDQPGVILNDSQRRATD
jgi:hypothetical protein